MPQMQHANGRLSIHHLSPPRAWDFGIAPRQLAYCVLTPSYGIRTLPHPPNSSPSSTTLFPPPRRTRQPGSWDSRPWRRSRRLHPCTHAHLVTLRDAGAGVMCSQPDAAVDHTSENRPHYCTPPVSLGHGNCVSRQPPVNLPSSGTHPFRSRIAKDSKCLNSHRALRPWPHHEQVQHQDPGPSTNGCFCLGPWKLKAPSRRLDDLSASS